MKSILVERNGKETEVGPVDPGCITVIRARKIWDEPFPFLRTSETFFEGPRFHYVEDCFRLQPDGRYHYEGTHPAERPVGRPRESR